jgi:DNA-binding MarR family transcriptional regulator
VKIEHEIHQKQFTDEYNKLGINILYTGAWLKLINQKMLKPYGLPSEQFNILRILRGQYPIPSNVTLIIDRMIDKSSNASRIVEKLRLKGYIVRNTSKTDRRQVDVLITDKGLELLKKIDNQPNLFKELFAGITEAEAHYMNDMLDILRTPL